MGEGNAQVLSIYNPQTSIFFQYGQFKALCINPIFSVHEISYSHLQEIIQVFEDSYPHLIKIFEEAIKYGHQVSRGQLIPQNHCQLVDRERKCPSHLPL